MPEFIQKDCNGEVLASTVLPYLKDPQKRAVASNALKTATKKMRCDENGSAKGNSNARAALAVLEILAPLGD